MAGPLTPPAANASGRGETRRVVTILFADVVGSTELVESSDPEAVRRKVKAWFTTARATIERHGGTVEKFIGDAVMAVFGVPTIHEDDAIRAVRAAADLRDASSNMLSIRIGVETGEVAAGDPADGQSFVTGNAVNTAARLQGAAEPGEVLIGEATYRLVRGTLTATSTGPLSLKGKRDPVRAHRLGAVAHYADPIPRQRAGPMVGRSGDLNLLRSSLELVRVASAPHAVTVIGQPGVGKSRLVHEFLATSKRHARILRARCLPYGDGITYWPALELIREAASISGSDPAETARERIAALVAGIDNERLVASRLSTLAGLGGEIGAPHEADWAVRRMLEHLALDRPVVVVVDDLQWAEPALVELLEHVIEWAKSSAILLLAIGRPELLEAHPTWLAGGESSSIRVEPLTLDEGAQLVDGLLDGLPLAIEARERIAIAADGNPLFIEQLLAMLVDDGALVRDDAGWVAHGDLETVAIPPSIAALLAARLDRLPRAERAALERASVIGEIFSPQAVADMFPEGSLAAVSSQLAALVGRELVSPDQTSTVGDETFRFRHLLVRDSAYGGISKVERGRLHERFADWLVQRSPDGTDEKDLIVGYHLEQAYRYSLEVGEDQAESQPLADRARRCLGPVGQAALERGDVRSAAGILRRAADLCPPNPERIGLLLDLSDALMLADDRGGSTLADLEAGALLTTFPDEGAQHRRRLTVAWNDLGKGEEQTYEGVIAVARAAMAFHERDGDRSGMARALNVAARAHASRGEVAIQIELLERAMDLAREIGRPDRAATYSARIASNCVDGSEPIRSALDRCRGYLNTAGDAREAKATILLSVGLLEALADEGDDWRAAFEEAKAIIDDLGLLWPHASADHPLYLAAAELAAGEPSRVEALLRWSCATLERLGDLGHLATITPLLAETLFRLGRLEEVEGLLLHARDISAEDDVDAQGRWRYVLASLRSRQGRHAEAVSLCREAVTIVAASEFAVQLSDARSFLADALRAAGDETEAMAEAHQARRIAIEIGYRVAVNRIDAFMEG